MNQERHNSPQIQNFLFPNNQSNSQCTEYTQIPVRELSGDQNLSKNLLIAQVNPHKSNMFLTIMTIMKTIIGVGILGLPKVFSELGYILGIILIILTSILNQYSCVLLIKLKNLSRRSNYSSIAYYLCNRDIILVLLYVLFIVNNFGICTAQLKIFSQIIQDIGTQYNLQNKWQFQGYFILGVVLALILVPLVLFIRIQKLRFIAFIGIFAIFIFIITVFINFFYVLRHNDWKKADGVSITPQKSVSFWEIIASVPNISLALLYQINFYPIYKGIQDSTDKKMLKASSIAIFFSSLFYLIISILGYFAYGNKLEILKSSGAPDIPTWLYYFMDISFLLSIVCSFPVLFFAGRNNFAAVTKLLIFKPNQNIQANNQNSSEQSQQNKKKRKLKQQILFYISTIILYIIIFVLAINVNLKEIFNLIGSTSSNLIGFVLPPFYYFRLIIKLKKKRTIHFYISMAMFPIFFLFGILTFVAQYLSKQQSQ